MYVYKKVKLPDGTTRDEHRLVMEAHIGRSLRSDEHIHHIDGNKRNNDISNLKILSKEDHTRHHMIGNVPSDKTKQKLSISAKLYGIKGSKQPGSKLTESDVYEIKRLIVGGELTLKKIAQLYNIDPRTISHIKCGRNWTHVNYP